MWKNSLFEYGFSGMVPLLTAKAGTQSAAIMTTAIRRETSVLVVFLMY